MVENVSESGLAWLGPVVAEAIVTGLAAGALSLAVGAIRRRRPSADASA